MYEEITNRSDENTKSKLLDLWKKETDQEKIKSEKLLHSKQKWLEDYEKNYGNAMVKNPERQKRKRNNYQRQRPNMDSVQQNASTTHNFQTGRRGPFPQQNQAYHNEIRQNKHSKNSNTRRNYGRQTHMNNTDGQQWRTPRNNNQLDQINNNLIHQNINLNQGGSGSFLWKGQFRKRRMKTFRFKHL